MIASWANESDILNICTISNEHEISTNTSYTYNVFFHIGLPGIFFPLLWLLWKRADPSRRGHVSAASCIFCRVHGHLSLQHYHRPESVRMVVTKKSNLIHLLPYRHTDWATFFPQAVKNWKLDIKQVHWSQIFTIKKIINQRDSFFGHRSFIKIITHKAVIQLF